MELLDHAVTAELTTSGGFSGLHRYTYHGNDSQYLLLDVCHTASGDGCSAGNVSIAAPLKVQDGQLWRVAVEGYVHMAGSLSSAYGFFCCY